MREERERRALNVVVLDDDGEHLEALALVLRAQGHHVVAAHTVDEAYEAAARRKPQVILTDLHLAGESGAELAGRCSPSGSAKPSSAACP